MYKKYASYEEENAADVIFTLDVPAEIVPDVR
jgi:hypothetical protein